MTSVRGGLHRLHQMLWALSALCCLASYPDSGNACPACLGPGVPNLTLVQKLIDSDQVVVAYATNDQPGRMIIKTVIQGDQTKGAFVDIAREELPPFGFQEGDLFLLGRQILGHRWKLLSPVSLECEPWLRGIIGLKRTSELTDRDWEERVRRFLPDLNHADALISSTAFGEIARAPYSAMRANRELMEKDKLLSAWQSEFVPPERKPLYVLLLGICGDNEVESLIDEHLLMLDRNRSADGLAAYLVAKLERVGPSAIAGLKQSYLVNRGRNEEERYAAYLALSIQGGGNSAIFREPIVALYQELIAIGQTSVIMITDLTSWSRWELRDPIRKLLTKSDLSLPARDAIQSYLSAASKVSE